ncbi:MAG: hypothetical protein LC800_13760 [Acidobacteria bacterium]|nr:hypothetical protein [Acidobacteriota bacterium]
MKRSLATALTSAALLALSVTAGLNAGAQTNQGPERTGEKTEKAVQQSCPVHPEFKARSAGRCPKCRADERKMKSAREKDKGKVNRPQQQQEEGSSSNE